MKARKKPIEIEYYPCEKKYIMDIMCLWGRKIVQVSYNHEPLRLNISTLEWTHFATEKDMIIKWINWEIYPIKKDIFEKTYEVI